MRISETGKPAKYYCHAVLQGIFFLGVLVGGWYVYMHVYVCLCVCVCVWRSVV